MTGYNVYYCNRFASIVFQWRFIFGITICGQISGIVEITIDILFIWLYISFTENKTETRRLGALHCLCNFQWGDDYYII